MRAFHAELNAIKRDEIAGRQLDALRTYQRQRRPGQNHRAWPLLPAHDGVPDFNALHSRKHDEEVQLYAFDILALDSDDL
jgi:hypothetical protein